MFKSGEQRWRRRKMENNYIACGNNVDLIKGLPDNSIDLVVTSPPYDDLRDYKGYSFDFEGLAKELVRVLKDGGVIVWIVADATIGGSETGTSFKQALHFIDLGLNLNDTMIWDKGAFTAVGALVSRYAQVFEYMFILSKGKPKAFNPIKDRENIKAGKKISGNILQKDGTRRPKSSQGKIMGEYGIRFNVWRQDSIKSPAVWDHPAMMPVKLARDHIISWSNEGDVVLDPFMGSGTTAIACIESNRKYIGFEISAEYCEMAKKRINQRKQELTLFLMGN